MSSGHLKQLAQAVGDVDDGQLEALGQRGEEGQELTLARQQWMEDKAAELSNLQRQVGYIGAELSERKIQKSNTGAGSA